MYGYFGTVGCGKCCGECFQQGTIGSHIKGCVARDIRQGNGDVIQELADTLQKLMK